MISICMSKERVWMRNGQNEMGALYSVWDIQTRKLRLLFSKALF